MLENVLFLIGVIVFFFVPYFIFYLKGISLKVLLPILTVSIVVMLFTLPDKYDFIGGVILYLWCYLVIIGVFKLFNYRIGFARVVRRCMIDPSDKDIYKLGKYIKNRRITYKWAKKECLKQSLS